MLPIHAERHRPETTKVTDVREMEDPEERRGRDTNRFRKDVSLERFGRVLAKDSWATETSNDGVEEAVNEVSDPIKEGEDCHLAVDCESVGEEWELERGEG